VIPNGFEAVSVARVVRIGRPMPRFRYLSASLAVSLSVFAAACAAGEVDPDELDRDAPLGDYDALFGDAPDNDTLPDEHKADTVYPAQYAGPLQWQSPVKSQGSRGVCSIFSTVGLMEHLYIKEGTITNPDFSEQYLQWSAKFEVGSFPNTSGSNASSNLEAINRFGIVAEADDPYETFQWGPAQDAACEGDNMPTRCYTNGEPSAEARAARKYLLPRGRWLNRSANSIKAHMTSKDQGVIVGLTFFYQSWNHRLSELPTNSGYWSDGYVLYPNEQDKELSLENRAGHSIQLVGWDDDLEVQTVDEEGNLVVDEEGNPVMEKGFFIFKNSWGTGSFGRDNANGDGYGYISMKYVTEYATAYVSDLPTIEVPDEDCGDGADNDFDGDTDCDDSDCAEALECTAGNVQSFTYESTDGPLSIPDNDPVGVASEIEVDRAGPVRKLTVTVDATHTYRGDLVVVLYRDQDSVVLHDRAGGGADDLHESYVVADFDGADMAGTWRLRVEDRAGQDVGTLDGWKLEIVTDAE
jgi:hypothetical protein